MKKEVFTVLVTLFLLIVVFVLFGCDNFSLFDVLANDISLVPGEITLNLNETIEFGVSAGIAPFIFTEVGDGLIPDGIYTAPSLAGNFTISVQDDRNRTAEAYVTVVDAVIIQPEIVSTGIGGVIQFTISGGIGPYNIDWDPLLGDYDTGMDIYTAGTTAGIDVITVTDFAGQIAEASVTILDTSNLMIIPEVAEVLAGGADFPFSASGGSGVYVYSIVPPKTTAGDSAINIDNGRYAPPTDTGIEIVRVTDTSTPTAFTAEATVYIVDALLTISPSISITLHIGEEWTFSAYNGKTPYVFSISPGDESSASIDSETGLFKALDFDASVLVTVTDGNGNSDTCRVKILK